MLDMVYAALGSVGQGPQLFRSVIGIVKERGRCILCKLSCPSDATRHNGTQ
jgi:hypothetical protein